MELVPWVEDVTVEIEKDGIAMLFSDSDILDVAYGVAERLLDELRKKGVIPAKGMREGKVPAKKADDESEDTTESTGKSFKQFRKQLDEQVYMGETDSRMYGDDSVMKPSKGKPKPKPCKGKDCDKLKPFKGYEETEVLDEGGVKAALEDYMYSIPQAAIEELKPIMKQKASTKKFAQITKILKKHGFTAKFMGSYPANVVNDYFDTFFGEVTAEETANFIEAKQQLFTGPGKKDSKRLIGVYTKSGKWIKDMSSEAEARKYVEKTQKESVQDTHLDEAFKKVGVSPDGKPVYSMNNKYYVVSYSVMARETAIFASDSKGNVSNWADVWSQRGLVDPDNAMKELAHASDAAWKSSM
jgi:hypothetical protein